VIGTWQQLPDGSWGVRIKGQARIGSIVTVRYKDAREPRTETVKEVLSFEDGVSVCSIERKTKP